MKISYEDVANRFSLPHFQPEEGYQSDVKPIFYAWKFSVAVPAKDIWPYIADSSLFNRHIGLSPRTETEKDGLKWVETTVFGVKQQWVEKPWTWVTGQSLEFVRNYTQGITRSVRCNMLLETTETGTDLYVVYFWVPQSLPARLFLSVTDSVIHDKFEQAVKTIEASYKEKNSFGLRAFPAALKAKNDPTLNVNLPELEKTVQKIKTHSHYAEAIDGIANYIKFADDADLYRIRAIELAQATGVKKREVISACMQSVRDGLLTISWDVVCPHCRGVRFEADSLGKIPPNSDCMVCDIDFETDTLESIEVTFHVHPSYRKVPAVLFCTAEPAKKDHIQAQQVIPPFGTCRVKIPLQEGRHRIRTSGKESVNFFFEANEECDTSVIRWNTDSNNEKIFSGVYPEFVLENRSAEPKTFTIEQLWWKDNILHPVDVFAIPEFQDVFSRESLNSQVRISLGIQTIMFTDIVNSTGFYNTRGDAAAFSAVRKHFTEAFSIIEKNEGTVIKTIGDSVMACFLSPEKAATAAIAIQQHFYSDRDPQNETLLNEMPIRLRISLHSGQVIAVHLNQGLDLFGNSVNKAAKLQACAGAGEIALSVEFYKLCDQKVFDPLKPFISKRTSNIQYKELPLEAEVVNIHQCLKNKSAPKSA